MICDTLAAQHRAMQLWLAEDNKGDVLLIKRAFARSPFPSEITVARTGEELLRLLEHPPEQGLPDVILLDINLPGISGHDVLQQIKNDELRQHIPTFILSSSSAMDDVMQSYKAHANCYIVKPFDVEKLRDIADAIGRFWYAAALLPSVFAYIHPPKEAYEKSN